MAVSKKQNELDVKKWTLSEKAQKDLCGTFDFCDCCKKEEENHCEKAYNRHKRKNTAQRQKSKATFTEKGKKEEYRANIVD